MYNDASHRDWINFERVLTPAADDEDLLKQTARCKVCGPNSAPMPRFRSEIRRIKGKVYSWKRNMLVDHLKYKHFNEYQTLPKMRKKYE